MLAESAEPALVSLENITVRYGDKIAIRDVSLEIPRGTILGLVGANGAGKSTLMGTLSGAIKPDEGSMHLDGEIYSPDSVDEARSAGVGYIPQHIELDPELTAAETIFRTSFRDQLPQDEKVQQARELLENYGININPEDKVKDLVPAEWASLEILRLTCEETQVVLLDEVTASFNDLEISLFHSLARRLVADGRSIMHISHRLDELQPLSDQIAVLRNGQLKSLLTPREVSRGRVLDEVFDESVPMQNRPRPAVQKQALLELDQVSSKPHLHNASLSVHAGEILGITGLRRSGLNELSEILGGVRTPDSGDIYVKGKKVTLGSPGEALEAGIAYIPEARHDQDIETEAKITTQLSDALNTSENGEGTGEEVTFAEETAQLLEVVRTLQRYGIRTANLQNYVGELSGGDQQKIALARTIGKEADVFVLNQPTRGIDELAKHDIYDLIDQLVADGEAVVITSSDMQELVSRCHRIAVVRDGELVSVRPNPAHTEDSIMLEALGETWGDQN